MRVRTLAPRLQASQEDRNDAASGKGSEASMASSGRGVSLLAMIESESVVAEELPEKDRGRGEVYLLTDAEHKKPAVFRLTKGDTLARERERAVCLPGRQAGRTSVMMVLVVVLLLVSSSGSGRSSRSSSSISSGRSSSSSSQSRAVFFSGSRGSISRRSR